MCPPFKPVCLHCTRSLGSCVCVDAIRWPGRNSCAFVRPSNRRHLISSQLWAKELPAEFTLRLQRVDNVKKFSWVFQFCRLSQHLMVCWHQQNKIHCLLFLSYPGLAIWWHSFVPLFLGHINSLQHSLHLDGSASCTESIKNHAAQE